MRTLHLCAGHGGGLLASLILDHPIAGAVEFDAFAQSVLRARQRDGLLPPFPISGDLRAFDARPLRGTVDLVAGGIPCQGFSGAGKQLGECDPRNLWPDALRVLKECRAPWFFLENVDRLTSFDYWGVILQDLATAGYDARWCVLSAGDVGAPHLRKRIWLLATDTGAFALADAGRGRLRGAHSGEVQQPWGAEAVGAGQAMADAGRALRHEVRTESRADQPTSKLHDQRCGQSVGPERDTEPHLGRMAPGLADRLDRPGWWAVERGLPRVAGKQPHRAQRLRGLGNGQVALCAAAAYRLLGGP